jgi:Spherulation-specific family 4
LLTDGPCNQVIHNPGTIPDSRYNDTNTDITVVFEDSYPAYQTNQASLAALPEDRSKYSYMINSVPIMDTASLQNFVDQLSQHAEFLFLTDNSQNFYESFGTQWANFTNVVPT